MNPSNHSSGAPGKGRRRRGRRPAGSQQQGQNQGQGQTQGRSQGRGMQQRLDRHERQNNPGGIYTAPMDHSYRAVQNGNGNGRPSFSGAYAVGTPDPVPGVREDTNSRIFAFVEDLFFLAKIQETARKMNVKVEFVKTEKELLDRIKENGEEKPSLIIFDLNNANAKPLTTIPRLKTKLKKGTSFLGFLSHIQGELKLKAQEAGCDMVVPRSAFSQNLPQLLRRHGATEEETQVVQ
jgi:hypothetical protein